MKDDETFSQSQNMVGGGEQLLEVVASLPNGDMGRY